MKNDKKTLALVSMGQELSAEGWGAVVGRAAGQCNGFPLIFGHAALALIAWLSVGSKSEVGRFAGKMQRERQAALKHGKVYPPVK